MKDKDRTSGYKKDAFTLIKMAKNQTTTTHKTQKIASVGEAKEKLESLCTVGRNVK